MIRKDSFHCTDLGTQLTPFIQNWTNNAELRKCPECGEIADAKEAGYAYEESEKLAAKLNNLTTTTTGSASNTETAPASKPAATTVEPSAATKTPVAEKPREAPVAAKTEPKPKAATAPPKKKGFFASCCGSNGHEDA